MVLETLGYGGLVPSTELAGAIALVRDVTLIVVPWLIILKMREKDKK